MLAKSSEAKVHDHFKLFGFNKRMVALSYKYVNHFLLSCIVSYIECYSRNAQLGKSFFSDFHFQLSAIDLAEDINYSAWRYLPQLSSISSTHATDNNPIVSSVKIFPHKIRRVINDHQHIVHSVLILLTTLEGGVISWNIDLASGKDQGCLTTSENAVPSTLLEKLKSDTCIGSAAFISNLGIHSTFTVLTDSHNSHSEDRKLAMVRC